VVLNLGGTAAKLIIKRGIARWRKSFAGITLVLRSRLVLLRMSLCCDCEHLLYFEQLRLVATTFADVQTRTSVFARIDWIVQSLTILAQLFITGRIASRLGLVVLLTIIPVAIFFGFVALAIWNTFAVLAVVIVLRRSGEYAFVRPGREMLWTPMSKETKYKAKNFGMCRFIAGRRGRATARGRASARKRWLCLSAGRSGG
jgi:AAA family ATP:ADP antiporter